MILLTIVLFLSKIFIGYKQNSLSLISGSFHLISDIAALVIGYSALRFAEQRVDGKYTFGVVRAEVLGATVNAIFLIAICFSLTVESLKRLIVPDQVENPEPVLIVGIIGLFINSVGLFLFRCKNCSCRQKKKKQPNKVVRYKKFSTDLKTEDSSSQSSRSDATDDEVALLEQKVVVHANLSYQLNIQAVFLHILQHIFVILVVITSALVIMYAKGGWTAYVDPVLSLVVVVLILKTSVPLLKECLLIFMQTVPANLQLERLRSKLLSYVPEVIGIHELHIWQLAGDEVVGSVHIVFRSHKKYNHGSISKIQEFFKQEGISSITVQPEFSDAANVRQNECKLISSHGQDCLLACSGGMCASYTCCETTRKILAKLSEE